MARAARPFIKMVGGKTQLLPVLLPILLGELEKAPPKAAYHEPFLGGAAVFFGALLPHDAHGPTFNFRPSRPTSSSRSLTAGCRSIGANRCSKYAATLALSLSISAMKLAMLRQRSVTLASSERSEATRNFSPISSGFTGLLFDFVAASRAGDAGDRVAIAYRKALGLIDGARPIS